MPNWPNGTDYYSCHRTCGFRSEASTRYGVVHLERRFGNLGTLAKRFKNDIAESIDKDDRDSTKPANKTV